MGSGLSMASVNKIKELAAQREYSLALDIIDSQDLSKSLNPQFLRLCGEVFIKSKRYEDARKTLLMARRLTPAAKRIIFSLADLYMRMGYKSLVDKYYELYMFDAEAESEETKQLNYIYDKYCGKTPKELEDYLIPYYIDNMEYDWSFEAFLLLCMEDKEDVDETTRKALIDEYLATFKNSKNSQIIASITDDESIAESLFYNFSKTVEEDDDPKQEKLRKEEKKLFEADELRIHPQEAEIIEIIDEEEEKASKNKKKKNKKEDDINSEQIDNESGNSENKETKYSEVKESEEPKDAPSDESFEEKDKKIGFFKKLFVRDKNKEEADYEETKPEKEAVTDSGAGDEEVKTKTEEVTDEIVETKVGTVPAEDTSEASQETVIETDVIKEEPIEEAAEQEPETTETVETLTETNAEIPDNEDFEMHKNVDEININMEKFSDDEFSDFSEESSGDEFAAESDTIEDLHLQENALDVEKTQTDTEQTDKKSGVLFEAVDISLDDDEDDNYDIDDFSATVNDEFGSMDLAVNVPVEDVIEKTEAVTEEAVEEVFEEITDTESEADEVIEETVEPEIEETVELEAEVETNVEEIVETEVDTKPEVEEAIEPEVENIFEEITEPETEVEEVVDPEQEVEEVIEPEQEVEEVIEANVEEVIEEAAEPNAEEPVEAKQEVGEAIEPEAENIFEEIADTESEAEEVIEANVEEVIEEAAEPDAEEPVEAKQEVGEAIEPEAENIFEEITEPEPEVEEVVESEPEVEEVVEPEEEYEEEDLSELFRLEKEKIKNENKEKKLEFPVFRSSLFPNYHNDKPVVENNFNEIMSDSQSKISENFDKEAQLQKETEALLASLGIDLGNIKTTAVSASGAKTERNDEKANSISRKELKNSLKIGEDKKIILRKMKEYR